MFQKSICLWGYKKIGLTLLGTALLYSGQLTLGQDSSTDLSSIAIPRIPQALCFGMTDISERRALEICDALSLQQTVKARELAQQWIREKPDLAAAQFAFSEILFMIKIYIYIW